MLSKPLYSKLSFFLKEWLFLSVEIFLFQPKLCFSHSSFIHLLQKRMNCYTSLYIKSCYHILSEESLHLNFLSHTVLISCWLSLLMNIYTCTYIAVYSFKVQFCITTCSHKSDLKMITDKKTGIILQPLVT